MTRCLPYAVLLAEVLLFFRRVLFSGRYALPWDFLGYHLPLASYIARCFRHGELPLWDPYIYCGFPFYANLQAQLFYPPTLLAVLASNLTGQNLRDWLEWQVAAHVFLAGIFAYRLLRRLECSPAAATVGATVFQLGGYFASQAQHLGAMNTGAWLPAAWLSVMELRDRFTWRWTAALAGSLTMAFLAGFPAATAVVFVSCFLLAFTLVLLRRGPVRLLAGVVLASVWAALLAAVQLLPTLELVRLSAAPQRGHWTGTGGGVPLQGLVSLVVPNYYHLFDLSRYSLPWNPTFLYLYVGLPGLVLALAVVVLRRSRYWPVFGLVTLLSAVWMLGESTPAGKFIYVALPTALKSALYAEFAMLSFVLGMAALAGLGAQAFLARRSRPILLAVVALTGVDLIAVGSGRPMNTGRLESSSLVSQSQFEGSAETLDRLRGLVRQMTPPARIEVLEDSMNWAAAANVTGVPTANGNEPLALARLLKVRLLFCDGVPWMRYYEPSRLDSAVMDLLNVRYVLSRETSDPPALKAAGLAPVLRLPGRHVHENKDALPRFFLVDRVRTAGNLEEALTVMGSADFDPRRLAVVEAAPGPARLGGAPVPKDAVTVREYSARRVTLEVDTPAPAFLVTSEAYYPGWRAFVDSDERPLLLTNAAFRGLPVPAGKHTVTMRFEPAVLPRSAVLSAGAWLGAVAALLFGDNRRKRGLWTSSSN